MIFSNILVPFDGSDLAFKSLEKAIELAKLDSSVKVTVLHVIQLPLKRVPDAVYNPVKKAIVDDGHETLSLANEKLSAISEQAEKVMAEGAPSKVILQKAQEDSCDLIIMGSRGLSGIKEFLGSISHYVSQNSHIPVLLVK